MARKTGASGKNDESNGELVKEIIEMVAQATGGFKVLERSNKALLGGTNEVLMRKKV